MSTGTLGDIRTTVRRITRSPSTNQLSATQLDDYINTFILYDFPASIRLFSLRTVLTFYTQPYVDTYTTSTTVGDPLYDFKNRYTAVHQPIFLAGIPGFYSQNRTLFFTSWPTTNLISTLSIVGTGVTGPYAGTLASGNGMPVIQNQVTFTTTDANGNALTLVDYPITNVLGALGVPGVPQTTLPSPYGQINYVTGVFTLTFSAVVPVGAVIKSETIPYQPSRPTSMLFYDNVFTLRPIPDMAYQVTIEADARPTELLAITDVPNERQWWQYVALGAAIKVFRDRMDFDSINSLWPEFQRQEDMVTRSSTEKQLNERTQTIFTQTKNYGVGWFMSSWPY